MIVICRNCEREYDPEKSQSEVKGYCTKRCMHAKAKDRGFMAGKAGQLTEYEILKARGEVGLKRKPKTPAIDTVMTPLEPQGESQAMVVYSPAAMGVVRKFDEAVLSFELVRPEDPRMLELLAVDPELPLAEALQAEVQSDADYRLADMTRIRLLDEADEIEAGRTSGTQPLNSVKNVWDGIFVPGVKGRRAAAAEIARRMLERDRLVAAEEAAKKTAEEAQLKRDQERVLAEADKESRRRERLKDDTLVEDSLRREEELRATATTMPTTLTSTAMSRPTTGGSNRAAAWKGLRDPDKSTRAALRSLLSLSEDWDLDELVNFKQSGMNTLAKFRKDSNPLEGFLFENETGLRRPKGR